MQNFPQFNHFVHPVQDLQGQYLVTVPNFQQRGQARSILQQDGNKFWLLPSIVNLRQSRRLRSHIEIRLCQGRNNLSDDGGQRRFGTVGRLCL